MKTLFAVLAIAGLYGCASEVVRQSSSMEARFAPGPVLTAGATTFRLDSGYSRTIAEGTEFVEIGSIREGRVLKPTQAVITVEGAHMHEAYPVERDGRLVGFYLPVEKAYSPLSNPADFPLQGKK